MKNNVIIAAMLLCASVNLAQNSNQSKGHKNMGAAVNMPVPFTVNVADSLMIKRSSIKNMLASSMALV